MGLFSCGNPSPAGLLVQVVAESRPGEAWAARALHPCLWGQRGRRPGLGRVLGGQLGDGLGGSVRKGETCAEDWRGRQAWPTVAPAGPGWVVGLHGGLPSVPWERGATCRPGDRGSHSQAGRGEGWPEPSQEGTPLRTGETRLGGQTLEGQEPWGPR